MSCTYQDKTIHIKSFPLSNSDHATDVEISCCIWGDVNKPLIVLMGGISANRFAFATKNKAGWWERVLHDNSALNLDHYSFLTFDYWSLSSDTEKQHLVTTFDQAHVLKQIKDQLNLPQFHAVIGSSYGGMVSLAFASIYPTALEKLVCLAAADKNSVKTQAIRYIQRQIIELGQASGNPDLIGEHLALARSLAVIGYRGDAEFEQRFQSNKSGEALLNVSSYLAYQGNKFKQAFSPDRYLQLSQSIDVHQVDASKIIVPTHLIAFDSDQLVPLKFIQSLHKKLNRYSTLNIISSDFGHDGFLLEATQINQIFHSIFNSKINEHNHDFIKPNHRCASGY